MMAESEDHCGFPCPPWRIIDMPAVYKTPAYLADRFAYKSGEAVLMAVQRYNRRHPDQQIRRYPGHVHLVDFQEAFADEIMRRKRR